LIINYLFGIFFVFRIWCFLAQRHRKHGVAQRILCVLCDPELNSGFASLR